MFLCYVPIASRRALVGYSYIQCISRCTSLGYHVSNIRRILLWNKSGDILPLVRLISFSGSGFSGVLTIAWFSPRGRRARVWADLPSRQAIQGQGHYIRRRGAILSTIIFPPTIKENKRSQRCQSQPPPTTPTPQPQPKSKQSPYLPCYHNMKQPTIHPLSSHIPNLRNWRMMLPNWGMIKRI